jgi:hypothetical protein
LTFVHDPAAPRHGLPDLAELEVGGDVDSRTRLRIVLLARR